MAETKELTLIQKVTDMVSNFKTTGELQFPSNYSPENALKSAWIQLSETKDKNGNPITKSCSQPSIANALLKMVTQGLSPIKNQCYFIPYGDQLNFQRSYQGTIALAKRVGNVKEVNANLIYEGDIYETQIDIYGCKKLVKHQSAFENRDENKIIGAYCVVVFNDGSIKLDDMSMVEIKRSWAQGATKGNSPAHQNFKGEMAKKTVVNRALKTIVNSSSDSDLFEEDEPTKTELKPDTTGANSEVVDFDSYEEIKEAPKAEKPKSMMEEKPTKKHADLFDSQKEEAGF
jgi:recombination protein RecT